MIGNENKYIYIKLFLTLTLTYLAIVTIGNLSFLKEPLDSFFNLLKPFVIGFILAYVLNPIINFLQNRVGLSRTFSIILTYLSVIIIFVVSIAFIVPILFSSVQEIATKLLGLEPQIRLMFSEINSVFGKDINLIEEAVSRLNPLFVDLSQQAVSSTISFLLATYNFVLGFLISIYVILDKSRIISFFKSIMLTIFKYERGTEILSFLRELNDNIGGYIGAKSFDSLIIAFIAMIGLVLLGSKYILLITVIVFLTNMIPYIGPMVAMGIATLINLFDSPSKALVVLIFLFLLQQVDAWYLDPKIVGNKLGLRPIQVVFAVIVGGWLYGPIGMILGNPCMALINECVKRTLKRYSGRTVPS